MSVSINNYYEGRQPTQPVPRRSRTADYIVVGLGAAGSVVLARLKEAGHTVIAIEAGPDNSRDNSAATPLWQNLVRDTPNLIFYGLMRYMPDPTVAAGESACNSLLDYYTEPYTNQLTSRRFAVPRAGCAGGCGHHHAQTYGRGSPAWLEHVTTEIWGGNLFTYNRELQREVRAWSPEDLLPYYKRLERAPNLPQDYHGATGWLPLVRARPMDDALPPDGEYPTDDLSRVTRESLLSFGVPYHEDGAFNWEAMRTLDSMHMQTNELDANNQRMNSYEGLLAPLLRAQTPGLRVLFNTLVDRVLIDDAQHAYGVKVYERASLQHANTTGNRVTVLANGERAYTRPDKTLPEPTYYFARHKVILCGGAFGSPQTLMLSGLGDRAQLEAHGIVVRKHLPGVGRRPMDHAQCPVNFELDSRRFMWSQNASVLKYDHVLPGAPDTYYNVLKLLLATERDPLNPARVLTSDELRDFALVKDNIDRFAAPLGDQSPLPPTDPLFAAYLTHARANGRGINLTSWEGNGDYVPQTALAAQFPPEVYLPVFDLTVSDPQIHCAIYNSYVADFDLSSLAQGTDDYLALAKIYGDVLPNPAATVVETPLQLLAADGSARFSKRKILIDQFFFPTDEKGLALPRTVLSFLPECLHNHSADGNKITLASADPRDPPRIHWNQSLAPANREMMRTLASFTQRVRRMVHQGPLSEYLLERDYGNGQRSSELSPGAWIGTQVGSPEEANSADNVAKLDELVAYQQHMNNVGQHPSGSVPMGPATSADAVVDHRLNVHGVTGLAVIDASVVPAPYLQSYNIISMAYAIGERGADLVLDQHPAATTGPTPTCGCPR